MIALSFRIVGRDALCHVILDIVVEDGVVILMVALRSGEFYHFIGYGFGVRHYCASGKAHLRVTFDVADFSLASRELHVRVSLEVVLRDGVANGVGCHHVLVVIGMLLEVFLQHEAEDG